MLNVCELGAAGDGVADDTQVFQSAMNRAADAGGGVVFVPPGTYRIEGTLSIPTGVTLKGAFESVPSHTGLRDSGKPRPEHGTTLLAYPGRGSEDGEPFITIGDNGTMKGIVVYYPEQSNKGVPEPYPWTVVMRGNNPALIDVELLNPYNAIDASRNQRHLIRNLQGQPLRRGVYVDAVFDIGRMENIHWNPWFSMEEELFAWQMANGEAFIFARADWEYVMNTFCFGYRIGYHLVSSKSGVCNGNFMGIGADDCWTPILVDCCAHMGVLVTNGEFCSFHGPDPTMVEVAETNCGTIRFMNCAFWGPNNQIAKVAGKGTVGFSDCTFRQWDRNKEGRHAIQAKGGSVVLRGNDFQSDAPQIELGVGVERAVVVGNIIKGVERIADHGAKSLQKGLNASDG